MTNTKKRIIGYILIGLAAILIIGLVIAMSPGGGADTAAELLTLGQRYLLELEFEQAIVMFTRVIDIDPRNVEALVGRGTAHILWQENIPAARADFERALEIDERNVAAWLGIVDIYIRLGEFDRALELARRGYEITGDAALRDKVQDLESGTVRDSEGRVRRGRHYRDGAFVFSSVRSYVQGRQTAITTFDPAGSIIAHGDFVFDEYENAVVTYAIHLLGELLRYERTFDSAGHVISSHNVDRGILTLFERDSEGRVTRSTAHGEQGPYAYALYERDTEGRVVRRSHYRIDWSTGEFYLNRYTLSNYEDEGRRVSSHYHLNRETGEFYLQIYTITERDNAGQLVSRTETRFNADGTVRSTTTTMYEYEIDEDE